MKRFFVLLFVSFSIHLYASPDYERTITEVILGTNSQGLVIYQVIKDTTKHGEAFILVKDIEDNQLIVISKITVSSFEEVKKLMLSDDFCLIVPELYQEKYLQLFGGNKNIYFLGSIFNINSILPKELLSYKVDRIEGIYNYKEYYLVVLLLVSENGFEQIRKVIVLRPSKV